MKALSISFLLGMILTHMVWVNNPAHAQDSFPFVTPKSDEVQIPKEPGWGQPSYRGWELVSIPGLVATYYDLDLDGSLDYQVIRKIIRKGSSEKMTIQPRRSIS